LVEAMRLGDPGRNWGMDIKDGYSPSYFNSKGISAYSILPIKRGDLFVGFIILEWFDAEKTPSKATPLEDIFTQSRDYIELELALR